MDRQLQPLEGQPFQDSVDTAFFFPGGARRKIVDDIKSALSSSVSLLLVTGATGTGKTMVCRMVEKELPDGMICVFLPKAINSFDDMVQIVLEEIRSVLDADSLPAETAPSVAKIAGLLQDRNLRLVIFFDEAEKIFLATLERVRRLLDQVNQEQTVFQFIFSGGESFKDNLKQLSMVTFSDIKELHFKLQPLNEEESCQYLNHCIKVATGVSETVFSQDLVSKISSGGATFKRLNHFALETFQSDRLDTSFLGLLDTGGEKEGIKPRQEFEQWASSKSLRSKEPNLEFLSLKKLLPGWILYGGGASVIVVLLLLWFGRSGDNEQIEEIAAEVPIIELKRVVPKIQPSVQQALVEKEKEVAPARQTEAEVAKEPVKAESEKTSKEQALVEKEKEAAPAKQAVVEVVKEPVKAESEKTSKEQALVEKEKEAAPAKQAVVEVVKEPVKAESEKTSKEQALVEKEKEAAPAKQVVVEVVKEPVKAESEKTSKEQALVEKEKDAAPAKQAVVEVAKEPVKAESEKARETQPLEQPGNSTSQRVAETKVSGTGLAAEKKQELPEQPISPDPARVEEAAAGIEKKIENEKQERREKVEVNRAEVTNNVMVEPLEQTEMPFSAEVIKEAKLPDIPQLPKPVVIIDDEKKVRESQANGEKAVVEEAPEGTLSDLSDKEVNALFLRRIAAGARWLVGGGSGKYTIQLMVLTSVQAEKSLKQMLRTVEYQSVINQLYILRRTGPDPTVMVFYGEYPNLAAARNGRNNLPVFLRKHNPYAISVFGAVEKATTPQ